MSLGHADTTEADSPAPIGPGPRLEGSPGAAPELGSSQEGSWFLGRAVDSVLGPGQWYATEQGRTWYGAYRTFEDEYAYCVDAGLKTPHPRYFSDVEGGEPIDAPATAWALSTHAQSDSAPVQAALSALVRLDDDIPHRHVIEPGHPADLGEDFTDAAAEIATIEEDASRLAGPYTLSVEIRPMMLRAYDGQYGPVEPAESDGGADRGSADPTAVDPAGADPAAVPADADTGSSGRPLLRGFPLEAVVSLTSASGHQVPGHRVRLSATGARSGDDGIVTGDEPTVVRLTDLTEDRITVEAIASDLPATSVALHRPRGLGSDRVQAVVTAGERTTATAQADYDRGPDPEADEGPRVEAPMPRPTTLPQPTGSPEQPDTTEAPDEEHESTDPSPLPAPGLTAFPVPTRTAEAPRSPERTQPPQETQPHEETQPSDESRAPDESRRPEDTQTPAETPQEEEAPSPTAAPQPGNTETSGPSEEAQPRVATPPSTSTPPEQQPEETVPVSLPRTGSDSRMVVGLAITLVAVGVGALTLTRRHPHH